MNKHLPFMVKSAVTTRICLQGFPLYTYTDCKIITTTKNSGHAIMSRLEMIHKQTQT